MMMNQEQALLKTQAQRKQRIVSARSAVEDPWRINQVERDLMSQLRNLATRCQDTPAASRGCDHTFDEAFLLIG